METMNQDKERNQSAVEIDSSQGLSWFMASSFIIAVVGNSALIILSTLILAGWGTLFLLVLCVCNACYAAICLGRCWSILEERYDVYKIRNRRPYSEIAHKAMGEKMKIFTSVCLIISLAGVSIISLLLASTMIAAVAAYSGLTIIHWILILALVLCPLMWLGTPKDFWPAAVLAVVCAVIEILLMIIAVSTHNYNSNPTLLVHRSAYTFCSAMSIILFTFGGISSFPAIQNDMKIKEQFPKAAILGFSVVLFPYLLLTIAGYRQGGDFLALNVIAALFFSGLGVYVAVLLAVHMLMAFLVTTNAICQEFEEYTEVPKDFGWKRVAVRVSILVIIVLAAAFIPEFQDTMNLLEGIAISLTISVFPCMFYNLLCQQQQSNQQWPVRTIPMHEKIYMGLVMVCGIIAGLVQTYNAVSYLINKPPTNIYI